MANVLEEINQTSNDKADELQILKLYKKDLDVYEQELIEELQNVRALQAVAEAETDNAKSTHEKAFEELEKAKHEYCISTDPVYTVAQTMFSTAEQINYGTDRATLKSSLQKVSKAIRDADADVINIIAEVKAESEVMRLGGTFAQGVLIKGIQAELDGIAATINAPEYDLPDYGGPLLGIPGGKGDPSLTTLPGNVIISPGESTVISVGVGSGLGFERDGGLGASDIGDKLLGNSAYQENFDNNEIAPRQTIGLIG